MLGLGSFGRSVVIAAARAHADAGRGPLTVTLVDRVATGRFHSMRMQHPALAAAVDVTCLDLDLGEPTAEAVDEFERSLTARPPTLVVVAFEDEALAWSSGLFVRNRVTASSAIVIRTESDGGLTGLLDATVSAPSEPAASLPALSTFPVLTKTVSLDLIDGGVREQIARALHEGHLRRAGDRRRSPRAMDPDDRRRQGIEPCRRRRDRRDAGDDRLPSGSAARWGGSEMVFTDAEIDQLAAIEHERWRAERVASRLGVRTGPRRRAKLNPLLVPWAEVPPDARRYNLDSVADIPKLLARAGFEIVRRPLSQSRVALAII